MAIPGEKAIQMVRNAHAQAVQLDIQVTAVVVDQSGRMIALGRMDRARPITVDIALNKAYTAASFQQPTKDLAGVAGQTWFQSLVVSSSGRIMPGGGALPDRGGRQRRWRHRRGRGHRRAGSALRRGRSGILRCLTRRNTSTSRQQLTGFCATMLGGWQAVRDMSVAPEPVFV